MDHSHWPFARRRSATAAFVCLIGTMLIGAPVQAQVGNTVYEAVNARPGDIVLQRNVAPRIAYRTSSPGMAEIVDPSPRSQIAQTLGTNELSDADYSSMGAGTTLNSSQQTSVASAVGNALGHTLGAGPGNQGIGGNMMAGPMGAISGTTRGVGDQVTGALAQLPMLSQPPSVGH
ncbi:hypothetical protein [Dyella tabacisoli]|uniref:Fap n=1 Tax=Dyella tabacisoli TaxID=2282381 RepID=A0A369UIU6_9GAMM|nr:hypothetical protein [Dyella tabacisoli]RDD80273.1 hypothetical protein DVJ77_17610 [Dyella tabacisoli]